MIYQSDCITKSRDWSGTRLEKSMRIKTVSTRLAMRKVGQGSEPVTQQLWCSSAEWRATERIGGHRSPLTSGWG